MSRRPSYAFADLGIGDRLVVPVNRRDPELVQHAIRQAAWRYRRAHDAAFHLISSVTLLPGFVVVERIVDGDTRGFLVDRATATLARWESRVARHGTNDQIRATINQMRRRLQRRAA